MNTHLARDLEQLQRDLLGMAGSVERAVHDAIQALQKRDLALAQGVIEDDNKIDQQENRIEEECLKVLALHQPVARDLRRVVATMMISTDLERMGDLAEGIAKRAIALCDLPAITIPSRLDAMAERTISLVRGSLDAFIRLDANLARAVCRKEEVNRLNADSIGELIVAMKANPDTVEAGLSLFSAVRQLERIADHATNVAEDVIYLVEGEIVRHHPEAIGFEGHA